MCSSASCAIQLWSALPIPIPSARFDTDTHTHRRVLDRYLARSARSDLHGPGELEKHTATLDRHFSTQAPASAVVRCVFLHAHTHIHPSVWQRTARWPLTTSQRRAFWSHAPQLRVPPCAHHGWPPLARAHSTRRSERYVERPTPGVGGGWWVVGSG